MVNSDFYKFYNVIDGNTQSSSDYVRGVDPSNRKSLWQVPVATDGDLDKAVIAAQAAFPKWSRTSWGERQTLIQKARYILSAYTDQMSALITKEGGKPIQFAKLEVQHSLGFLDFFASRGPVEEKIIQDDDELRLSLSFEPVGIVGAICPWNYPLVLAISKIGASLVTGNCIIIKPSPFTPYSILKFAELVIDVFPAGVLQVLNGNDTLGSQMCSHPQIHKISFTGSTATGKKIMASTAQTLKRITLELGGNSACIVCRDVDPEIVAPQVAIGAFFNSGQLCVASKRIYVHSDIYDDFLKIMVETVRSWKVGVTSDGEQGVTLGPVQNEMQFDIVKKFFEDTVTNGYKFALGGSLATEKPDNFIIQPAIIANPPDSSLVVTGEAFGPIVPVLSWSHEDELIDRVNDTTTGLGGTIWSSNIESAKRLASRIEAGTIWINSFEKPLPQGYLSGYKESGVGGEWGEHGLLAYCNAKSIHMYKARVGRVG